MASNTHTVLVPGKGMVTLHFNSRIAKIMGGKKAVNMAVTPCATHIFISKNYILRRHLAHEWGHVIEALKRGILYLPWVLFGYGWKGYEHSKAEIEADDNMNQFWREFPDIYLLPDKSGVRIVS